MIGAEPGVAERGQRQQRKPGQHDPRGAPRAAATATRTPSGTAR